MEKGRERGEEERSLNLKGYYPSQMLWVINSDMLRWALLGIGTALSGIYMALISRSLDNLQRQLGIPLHANGDMFLLQELC